GMKGSYSEDDAPNPRSIYARTKHIGEEAALILADDVAVCRTALVYSARRGVKWTFPLTVLESLRAGKQVKAFTDQIGSPTLADTAPAAGTLGHPSRRSALGELLQYRPLVAMLVVRELKVRYKRSIFGLLWTMLNPLLLMVVYTVVFATIMKAPQRNFAIFLL